MAFNFFKRGQEDSPPDIGQEEEYDSKKGNLLKKTLELKNKPEVKDKIPKVKIENKNNIPSKQSSFEIQKINARLETLSALFNSYSERFSNLSERIGEVRSMAINNEKDIASVSKDSTRAIDAVKEVKPDKLRIDYQKLEMKLTAVEEKMNSTKQFMDTVMNELKDIRKKMGTFIGTEALLNLSKEVKDDLLDIQKLGSRVKINADKSEEIFIELKNILNENQKTIQTVKDLDSGFTDIQKDIQRLKIDYSNVVNSKEFNNFKSSVSSRLSELNRSLSKVDTMKDSNERLGQLIEKILGIEKRNEEQIKKFSSILDENNLEGLETLETKFNSVLNVIDSLAEQIRLMKKGKNKKLNNNSVNLKSFRIEEDDSLKEIKDSQEIIDLGSIKKELGLLRKTSKKNIKTLGKTKRMLNQSLFNKKIKPKKTKKYSRRKVVKKKKTSKKTKKSKNKKHSRKKKN